MLSVNYLDREELEFALAYLVGALPCRAKGVALVTIEGELVGQFLAQHQPAQIEALVGAARHVTCHFADAMGNGSFSYNLNVGAEGATLTLLLDTNYLVAINVRELKSVDTFMSGVRDGLAPLLDILGVRG
jgi:hypothetical protein